MGVPKRLTEMQKRFAEYLVFGGYKQKESEWIKTQNLADGYKKVIDELSAKLIDQVRIIAELEK